MSSGVEIGELWPFDVWVYCVVKAIVEIVLFKVKYSTIGNCSLIAD